MFRLNEPLFNVQCRNHTFKTRELKNTNLINKLIQVFTIFV